ncbi:MAG: DUF4870 domain-containing protein [Patescibacteria group bacterium]
MDDDNVIKPNQDFQIPPTTTDSQAVNGTQGVQDSNATQNVNNDDSSKQGAVNTQTPVPPTDSEPIKINDPYDFVLGNKNTTHPEPNISQVTSTDNPLQSKPLDNTSTLPPLESNSGNTQASSVSTGIPNINIPTDSVQNKESAGSSSQDSSTLGGLDYSQGTATSVNIPTNKDTLSSVGSDDVDKNKAEINDVLNSALSMDNFKNLNKPIEPQEVPDPYTNVTSPSPDGSQSTNSSYTTVNSETPSQSATISGNTYQNPDFVNPSNDTNLPPIPNQNPQQGGFSQTSEGTFINPYATSQANAAPTNDQTQGTQVQGAQVQGQTQNADTPPDRSEDIFGVVSYVIGLNILILIYSYLRNDKFLKFHAVQSIGFNLVFIVIFLVFTSLSRGSLSLAFLIANVVLFIVWVLLSILLMYKAYQGEKYPFMFFGMLANKLS